MTYVKGSKVRVRSVQECERAFNTPPVYLSWLDTMHQFASKEATVTKVCVDGACKLDIDKSVYWWVAGALQPVTESAIVRGTAAVTRCTVCSEPNEYVAPASDFVCYGCRTWGRR